MAGISIDILSNVTDVIRGAKRTGDALGDVADALDDLSDAGKQSGRELGSEISDGLDSAARDAQRQGDRIGDSVSDGLRDAGREADRQGDRIGDALSDGVESGTKEAGKDVDRLERKFKDLADATKRTDLDPGKSIATSTKKGMHEAGESVETFSDEAKSNLSEVASSFTGDAQSVVDLVQGTLGGVIADLGPLGLAAGAAGAVGVGLIGQAFVQAGEDRDAFKERVKAMTDELVSEFTDQGDAVSKLDARLREWAADNEKYGISLVDLRKDTRSTGVEFSALADVLATGTTPELRKATKQVQDHIDALREQEQQARTGSTGQTALSKKYGETADRLQTDVLPALKQQQEAQENATAAEEAFAAAQGQTVDQYEAYVAAANASKQATEDFANSMTSVLADAAESTSEALDNTVLDASKYIAGLDSRTKAAQQYQANVQTIGEQLPGDLFNFVREQGPGFSQEIATYLSASPDQRARIEAGWKIDAQVTADTSDVDKKTAAKGKEKKAGPTSQIKGDTSDVDKKTDAKGKEKKAGPTVKLRADDSDVDDKLAALRDRIVRGPTVKLRIDSSALDTYLARPRTITVNVRQGQEIK